MATFVLVHGGHHGGWAWRDVARGLRAAGHDVFSPTLTGLGERVHLMSGRVSQDLHAEDVANVLYYEDLREAVLVGHSYGGIVITLAAERSDRIGQLVYLDGMVPRHGQTFIDLLPEQAREPIAAAVEGEPRTFPVAPPLLVGLSAWMIERLVPQPAMDLDQPILLPTAAADKLPRTYAAATILPPGFENWRGVWENDVRQPPWRYVEYEGDHEAVLLDPGVVTSLLLTTVA